MLFNEFPSQTISRGRELSHLCLTQAGFAGCHISFVRMMGNSFNGVMTMTLLAAVSLTNCSDLLNLGGFY